MEAKLTLDQAGRVLIPKALREQLRLGPGDVIELKSEGDAIHLRPARPRALLKKELGVWVYQGAPLDESSITAVIDQVRGKRLQEFMG